MKPPSPIAEPLPSFYAALAHKVHLIVWAEGGKRAAARKLGVDFGTLRDWLRQICTPGRRSQAAIDAAYLRAWEQHRLGLPGRENRGRPPWKHLLPRVNSVDGSY